MVRIKEGNKMSADRMDALIAILADRTARVDERDDAAIDLGSFDHPRAIEALLSVARRPDENDTLLSTAGESLAMISMRRGKMERAWLTQLTPPAAAEYVNNIRANQPMML